jgi:hypothetical protein
VSVVSRPDVVQWQGAQDHGAGVGAGREARADRIPVCRHVDLHRTM